MSKNIAIFPGSFDPLTLGHIDIINTGLKLFKTIIIGIGVNDKKKHMFDVKKRNKMINSVFLNNKCVTIKEYRGLTIEFCKKQNANYIIRGIRDNHDFNYEKNIALANQELDKNIETLFIPPKKPHMFISSSIVREIIANKGNLSPFLPKQIIEILH